MAGADVPFKVDYAKSAKEACAGCGGQILKDELQLAFAAQSAPEDGVLAKWFHFDCFSPKNELKTTNDIGGLCNFSCDDQKRIAEKIEYTKRSRSMCRGCEKLITKGSVRISTMEHDTEWARACGPYLVWYHAECFYTNSESHQWFYPAPALPGHESLDVENEELLKQKLPKTAAGKRPAEEENYRPSPKRSRTEDGPARSHPRTSMSSNVVEPTITSKVKPQRIMKVLAGCEIVIEATEGYPEAIKAMIVRFGGKIVEQITPTTLCVISTKEHVDRKSATVEQARMLEVSVVSESFLEDCENGSLILGPHKLAEWGNEARLSKILEDARTASELPTELMPPKGNEPTLMITLNALAVVDPYSGLYGVAEVVQRDDEILSCVLGKSDPETGESLYFKIQVLEYEASFIVFWAWGRVGTSIRGKTLEEHQNINDAILHFGDLFASKTGNVWSQRRDSVNQRKYYSIIEADFMQDESSANTTQILLKIPKQPRRPVRIQMRTFDFN